MFVVTTPVKSFEIGGTTGSDTLLVHHRMAPQAAVRRGRADQGTLECRALAFRTLAFRNCPGKLQSRCSSGARTLLGPARRRSVCARVSRWLGAKWAFAESRWQCLLAVAALNRRRVPRLIRISNPSADRLRRVAVGLRHRAARLRHRAVRLRHMAARLRHRAARLRRRAVQVAAPT